MKITALPRLHLVTCASKPDVLAKHLLASPCVRPHQAGALPLTVHFNVTSAAAGFNATMASIAQSADRNVWLVWVHQDVYLPENWEMRFVRALTEAEQHIPELAVAGVYGVSGFGHLAQRAGHLLDRGAPLHEAAPLPCEVDSLDELLFAVRVDSGLLLDAALGFDFYATDLVLQAQARGLRCAVLDAYCEHWSDTPQFGSMPAGLLQRVLGNANVFERKWSKRLPVTTPCFDIAEVGDVARAISTAYRMP